MTERERNLLDIIAKSRCYIQEKLDTVSLQHNTMGGRIEDLLARIDRQLETVDIDIYGRITEKDG